MVLKIIKSAVILICIVFLLNACNNTGNDQRSDSESSPAGSANNESQKMVHRLKLMRANIDPMENSFMSEDKVTLMEKSIGTQTDQVSFKTAYELAYTRLHAGQSAQAALDFEDLLKRLLAQSKTANKSTQRQLKSMLAIAYMRMGEQANCVVLHGNESCLFPISLAAVHENQFGAQKAKQVLAEILQEDSEDLVSKWLYNLAAQTLGEYPEGVKAEWLIPMSHFKSDIDMPRFINIAKASNSDVTDLAGSSITEDFNGDGLIDILASGWGSRSQLRLLINDSKGGFFDQTQQAGLTGLFGGLHMVPADFDNDGDVDVFLMRGAWQLKHGRQPNSLLLNDGNGNFMDVTESSGLLSFHPTQAAAWGDFDNDGWVDLFIGNEQLPGTHHFAELYHNNQDGTFTEVAAQAGLEVGGFVKGVVWGDYDNDGLIDLYVSRMADKNQLFRNESSNGLWSFVDVAEQAGVAEPIFSFPTWFWDFDNDGLLDIFVADFTPNAYAADNAQSFSEAQALQVINCYINECQSKYLPKLYKNIGQGQFNDVTKQFGLTEPLLAMGANFGDIDNDGYLDMYIGTGAPDYRTLIPNRMFRNDQGYKFQDVTTTNVVGHLQKGHGISFADFDNDGDQDIYAVMGGAYSGDVYQNALFQNPGHGNHWITLRLIGTVSNRSAIGAKVDVFLIENGMQRKIHRRVTSGSSFGANSLQLEIGLGQATKVEMININWPSGQKSSYENIDLNQIITITEGQPTFQTVSLKAIAF